MDADDIFGDVYIDGSTFTAPVASLPARPMPAHSYESLSARINRLVLINHALTEILREKLGVTDQDIVNRMMEIDLRDGIKDGQFAAPPRDCPKCAAKICRQFNRWLFCGHSEEGAPLHIY